ncbi:MAG: SOS response-associated peptidase [Fimbriimonadaceae bacterium]|nr:SOS response-associated peptidase [Fimbriimonadaceae bacterium]
MCARFSLFTGSPVLEDLFDLEEPVLWEPHYNIAPSEDAPAVLLNKEGHRTFLPLTWGLVPHWAKDPGGGARMINARSETVREKPAFRDAFARRRCLIPADGFFEWRDENGKKAPYFITRLDHRPFAMAGIWDRWKDDSTTLRTCSILTTEPNRKVAELHNRMPVILHERDFDLWLDPEAPVPALESLFVPYEEEQTLLTPVTPRMGNPRYKEPDCVLPVVPDQGDLFG